MKYLALIYVGSICSYLFSTYQARKSIQGMRDEMKMNEAYYKDKVKEFQERVDDYNKFVEGQNLKEFMIKNADTKTPH